MDTRYNYGVALSSTGEYQAVDTASGPGVKDDYSRLRSEPFTFLVAPHDYVDKFLKIAHLTGNDYILARKNRLLNQDLVKVIVLRYHGVSEVTKKPTWAADNELTREDTDWYTK